MRKPYLLICCFLAVLYTFTQAQAGPGGDPIELSKKIIKEAPDPWKAEAMSSVLATYGNGYNLASNDKKFVLLESPELAFSYFKGGFEDMRESIPKKLLLQILNDAIEMPAPTGGKVARATIYTSLKEYKTAFGIAEKFKQTNNLSYEEAITFLENRFGYDKLDHAIKLISNDNQNTAASDNKSLRKVRSKLKEIEKKYPNEIAWKEALPLLEEWYQLLENSSTGLASFSAYQSFKRSMSKLNSKRIQERDAFKSNIKITYPKGGVTWMAPGRVDIKWQSTNIDTNKKIRFFLIKDDVVIQDLGIYDNNNYQEGIRLDRGLPNGDNYRVMGIEQNPVHRYQVAKFATPFFTVKKAPRPKKDAPIVQKPKPEPKEIITTVAEVPEPPVEKPEESPVEEVIVEKEIPKRMEFDGRSISYRKELEVSSETIQINLWDHGRRDGDIVSIYVNGEAAVYKHSLDYTKKQFDIQLKKGIPNDLFLYAHNLGKYPPNTVAIEIIDGEGIENIVLNSDLKSCEAVLINVKQ